MKAVIGVDGGVSGAICYLNDRDVLEVIDVPTIERQVNGKPRQVLDADRYLHFLHGLGMVQSGVSSALGMFERGGEIPFVDRTGRRRAQSGMYPYGFTNGQLFMGALALGIPSEIVEPQTWKRHFHLLGKGKEASREKASELYPFHAYNWKNKGHHNRAEAVLIATYAMEQLGA